MIFKTFQTDLDGISNKIGFSKRSFAEWGKQVSNSFKESEGIINSFKNALKTAFTVPVEKDNSWIKNKLGEIVDKDNINSYIPELTGKKASDLAQRIREQSVAVADATDGWEDYFAELKNSGQGYIVDLIKNTDDLSKLTGEDLVKANQQARASALAHNEAIKAQTFSAKASKVALKGLSVVANTITSIGLSLVASKVVSFIYDMATANEKLLNSAKELSNGFVQEKETIEDYKNKIEELKSIIDDNSSSYDKVSQARKDLMVVQDELIKKFGTEKETIDIITNAINDQSNALDELTKKQYQQWKNNFNDKSFAQSASDFLSSDNIGNAIYKLTEFDFSGAWEMLTAPTESNIDKMVDSMRYAYYKIEKTGNDTLDSLIAKTYDLYDDGSNFILDGNLDDIYEDLLEIQNLANDFDVSDSFETSITKVANAMDKTLKSYKEAYDTYILYEKILNESNTNQYDEQSNLINKAKEAYDNAVVSGNQNKIEEASDEYAKTLQSAIDLAMGNYDYDVADYFKAMYPELQQMFGEWQFSLNFEPNTDGLQDKVADALDSIDGVSDGTTSFSVEDIENFNPSVATQEQIDAYGELTNVAETYGLTIKQLITLLQTMGLIQSESYQQLTDTFGQDSVDKLSPEYLEIAYTIKNVGNMTFEQLQTEIQKSKELADENPISTFEDAWADSFTSENDKVRELGNTLLDLAEKGRLTVDTFNEADSTEYFKNLGISADIAVSKINKLVDESKQLSSMSDQISSMSEALATKKSNGFVEADTLSGFDVEVRGLESWDRFQEVLGSTTSSYQECQEAANELATEWVNSSDFLAQLTEDTKEYYKTQLESMGVENYDEVIESTLALKEAKEALIDVDLSDASYEDIEALITEGEYSALVTEQMWALYYAKLAESGTFLDSSADCAQLQALANDAMLTAEAVELLNQLIQIYNGLEAGAYNNNRALRAEAVEEASRIKSELENLAKGEGVGLIAKPELKVNGNKGKKSGGSGSSKDKWKEQYDAELKELEHMHKLGLISDEEYWKARMDLNEKYFGESSGMHEKYLEEYQENEEDILEGIKKLWEDYYDERKNNLKDLISYAEKLYDKEIDSLEANIKQIEEKRDTEKKYWQGRIDAIGDEIDALEDANDERERAIDLQQKQWNLQKAMHQRTMLINYMSDTIVI